MMERGRAELGQKTVLDGLDAVAAALNGAPDPKAAALAAAHEAQVAFRDRPAQVGRARIFAERSLGMDDPGMLALTRMLEAIAKG
jgi:dihydroxyacetone kinase-like protein